MKGSMSGRGLLLVVSGLLLLAVGVGSALGAIPNPGDGRFYACRVKDTGALHMINYPKVSGCPKGQKLMDWGRTGPQGPQGLEGAPGAQGIQGAQGLQGLQGSAGITKITLTSADRLGDGPCRWDEIRVRAVPRRQGRERRLRPGRIRHGRHRQ